GGPAERFVPYIDLFERAQDELEISRQPIAVHSPGLVAETDAEAHELLREGWIKQRLQIGRERGWPSPAIGDFEREIEGGALYAGSPETVAKKIVNTLTTLKVNRFDLKYDQPVQHSVQL